MIHSLIDTTTASVGTGLPTQRKLFRAPSGPFAGRLAALYGRSASTIGFSHADPPAAAWRSPSVVASDSDDLPFAAAMDAGGTIHLAYTVAGTGALAYIKMVFTGSAWAKQLPVTIYTSATSVNKYPSVAIDTYGYIWVSWTREDAGTASVRSKTSFDGGLTFGGGSSDPGTDLSGAVASAFSTLIPRSTFMHCLYTTAGTTLVNRDIDIESVFWNNPDTLYTGTGCDENIAATVANDGTLGCVFTAEGNLYLKEFDGAVWGALQTVHTQPVFAPVLRYVGTAPYVLFLKTIGSGQDQLFVTHRSGSAFTIPAPALSQSAPFASVLCHDIDAPTPFADLTAEAADTPGADVRHPQSGALLAAVGDAVYCGGDDRFAFVRMLLSTPGSGGTVAWSYWNGSEWSIFVPDSGDYQCDQADAGVRLFPDGVNTPADWQRSVIAGHNRYWIRVSVTTAFNTLPIGSQLTPIPTSSGATSCC